MISSIFCFLIDIIKVADCCPTACSQMAAQSLGQDFCLFFSRQSLEQKKSSYYGDLVQDECISQTQKHPICWVSPGHIFSILRSWCSLAEPSCSALFLKSKKQKKLFLCHICLVATPCHEILSLLHAIRHTWSRNQFLRPEKMIVIQREHFIGNCTPSSYPHIVSRISSCDA